MISGVDPRRRLRWLEAMGLGPVWRLRDQPATVSDPVASDAESVPAGTAAPMPRAAPGASVAGILVEGMDGRAAAIARMDWGELRTAVAGCTACALARTRNNTVFGVGNERAPWMVVGEAPGAEEDARGEPFVGQAGRLLDAMLAALGLTRERDVYIANVLKCRPPGNRNPEPGEVAQCAAHLHRQLDLVQPQLVIAMGRFAAQTLLDTEASIASLRGRVHHYRGRPLIVTYHPAYLLRTLADKARAWEDLCLARRTVPVQAESAGDAPGG